MGASSPTTGPRTPSVITAISSRSGSTSRWRTSTPRSTSSSGRRLGAGSAVAARHLSGSSLLVAAVGAALGSRGRLARAGAVTRHRRTGAHAFRSRRVVRDVLRVAGPGFRVDADLSRMRGDHQLVRPGRGARTPSRPSGGDDRGWRRVAGLVDGLPRLPPHATLVERRGDHADDGVSPIPGP